MKTFITEDFLLQNKPAKKLYHEYAANMPIYDYHCHLSPQQIAGNACFSNLTQIWLYGDHYKWRGMRSNGIAEKYCTGNASDYEKFYAWAETVPYTLMNPLYHWTHLELLRYFGIKEILDPQSAKRIYDKCSSLLAGDNFRVQELLTRMNVRVVCTTDDPADSLADHIKLRASDFAVKTLPTFRPDRGMNCGEPAAFNEWLAKLEKASGVSISSYRDFLEAVKKRHDFFHEQGCRISDHGLEEPYAEDYSENEISGIFSRARSGKIPDSAEIRKFKSALMREFALMDYEKGWAMQLHFGVIRNNNTRMFKMLGPDTGFDSIGHFNLAKPLARFLDSLDSAGKLPKTILYNINPADNEILAAMLGNFQDETVPGKIQFGSGWWFLDQKDGMIRQLTALSSLGLLPRFIGMLTDSRSFLSYPRHEYFRRILCNLTGKSMADGELPADYTLIGRMIKDICYNNAEKYFGIPANPYRVKNEKLRA
ncbi:MAG: glucuronate isomerase [Spirochaetes bacterium GWF1_41_5]|nr:MAG: glucuronate isomerase [Spirochaetes bacterium GWF1_41_5]HBE01025.1 glucuronate isomerase [Spirochaetia bacterium]